LIRPYALWRAVGGDQAGFLDHGLGSGDAQAGGLEIRPGLLRTTRTHAVDVQPVSLGEGMRHAGFNLRGKSGQNGEGGSGNDCTGHGGDDTFVPVPVGTVVSDLDTGEQLGDLTVADQTLLVASGGKGGWGNTRFKSSTNRTPRKAGLGLPGEKRELGLELKLIADVGLLGLPNAGKSTLIRAVSAARPKVADYPFTTLHPNLGVVAVGAGRSFVMADIPGLIEGAAEGAGLGIRFLKHLQRTRVLLHLVDIAPPDPDADPVKDARTIVAELKKFAADLGSKERWLIINKIDLLEGAEAARRAKEIVRRLRFKGPVFLVSGATGAGTDALKQAVMRYLEEHPRATLKPV